MIKAVEEVYDAGRDAHGRKVTVRYRRSYDGKDIWSITIEPYNQRDERQVIEGLALDNLRKIGEIAK